LNAQLRVNTVWRMAVQPSSFTFTNDRGHKLYGVEWLPPGQPWAHLVFHHGAATAPTAPPRPRHDQGKIKLTHRRHRGPDAGVAEYSGRYDEGAPRRGESPRARHGLVVRPPTRGGCEGLVDLPAGGARRERPPRCVPARPRPPAAAVFRHIADCGVAVHTYDIHGHGRSEPQEPRSRCYVRRWQDLASPRAAGRRRGARGGAARAGAEAAARSAARRPASLPPPRARNPSATAAALPASHPRPCPPPTPTPAPQPEDLSAFVRAVEERAGAPLPRGSAFLAGHSMGGLVVSLVALRDQGRWAGVIPCSAALGVDLLG
jgi:pimeloyl-ACP methyl ester carboxylesterase